MRLGWYRDEYVRTADGWRIRRRATTFMRKHGGFDSGHQHDPLADDASDGARPMTDIPKIISVDDHVVEPAHLWQERLPATHARAGPARRAGALGRLRARRRRVVQAGDDRRRPVGRLLGLRGPPHLRAQAPRRDPARRHARRRRRAGSIAAKMFIGRDRPTTRCGRAATSRRRASTTSRSRGVDGSLAFPTFPRFCGQTFLEGNDLELGLECVRAYNDWMIDEWCADSGGHLIPLCLIPLWDVELAVAEIRAQRGARRARRVLQRDPDAPRAAEHPHRLLGSAVRGVRGDAHDAVHAHRVVVEDAGRVARRAAVDRDDARRSTTRWRRSPTTCSRACSCGSRR